MADIFVFAKDCEAFDTLGLCGPLTPLEGTVFAEEANGLSEVTVRHPIDEIGRWSFLIEDNIVEASVPVRTTPEIVDGVIVTSIEEWHVKSTATKNQRGVYTKATGGKLLKRLAVNTKVYVVDKGDTRYKIKWKKGFGYIAIAAIEYDLTLTELASDPAAIELAVPAWSVRPQLFRIYSVLPNAKEKSITAKARHISYDILGNMTTYTGDNPTCGAALAGILAGCAKPHDVTGRTNISDQRVIGNWTDVSPMDALLNDETGLVNVWGADLVRDNWELTVLDDAGMNRGVRIEYGKNLTGVECAVDVTDLITSIRPIGQTSKGKPLYLAAGSYEVNGQTVVVGAGLTVDSPNAGAYAVPHVYKLDVGQAAKATGTTAAAVLAARKKMIAAALDKFEKEMCDIPLLSLKVEFIPLGDTEEGAQFKQLENVYLFDRVSVWHPKIGVDVLTEVNRIEFDPVRERFLSVETGPVRRDATRVKLPSWQLPPAIQIATGAVGPGALSDDVPDALDLTNNETVQAVAQQYVRNAWITGEQVFKYPAGSETPNPASITVAANLQNVLMDRWQYKDSDGIWTDYPVGDGNATNTATALVVKPGHAVWVGSVCTLQLLTDDPNINDTFCLYKVADGATGGIGAPGADGLHGLTAILSNAAHALPKTTDGAITYTGSGTALRLFEGATELAYDGVGTANGTWKVTTSASGITCGSLTDSGAYLTVGNHSGMGGSTASVTYNITGKRGDGTVFSLSITQSLSVAQQGATGTPAIVLHVYAPNGAVFTNQAGTLLLSAVGYSGANQITSGATYVWKKYTGGSWVTISGETASTLTVSGDDVAGLQAYKCEMTYGGVVYSGTVTLTDKTDNYQAAISSTGGDTFRNGDGSSAMVCRLWQNGAEVDALKSAVISPTAPSSPTTGAFYYKITPSTPQVALMRWSGSAWVDVTTNPTYAHSKNYTWYRLDKDGNALDGGAAFATGKVIYVDGDDVDVQTTWECEVA